MTTYTGGCHCGKVRFSATADLAGTIACNCSHCAMKGFLLTFVPESAFTLLTGADDLAEYRFNQKQIAHLFCTTCGVQPIGKGDGPQGATVAINVRCLDGVDPDTIDATPYDGKSM